MFVYILRTYNRDCPKISFSKPLQDQIFIQRFVKALPKAIKMKNMLLETRQDLY